MCMCCKTHIVAQDGKYICCWISTKGHSKVIIIMPGFLNMGTLTLFEKKHFHITLQYYYFPQSEPPSTQNE